MDATSSSASRASYQCERGLDRLDETALEGLRGLAVRLADERQPRSRIRRFLQRSPPARLGCPCEVYIRRWTSSASAKSANRETTYAASVDLAPRDVDLGQ